MAQHTRAILHTLGMPTSGSRPVLLRRMYMMTLALETPLLEMQGAGLTPLNFAICLLRIGGHLGREEALRSIGYISTQRVAPRSGLESLRTGGHLGPEPPRICVQLRLEALLSSKGAAIPAGALYFP